LTLRPSRPALFHRVSLNHHLNYIAPSVRLALKLPEVTLRNGDPPDKPSAGLTCTPCTTAAGRSAGRLPAGLRTDHHAGGAAPSALRTCRWPLAAVAGCLRRPWETLLRRSRSARSTHRALACEVGEPRHNKEAGPADMQFGIGISSNFASTPQRLGLGRAARLLERSRERPRRVVAPHTATRASVQGERYGLSGCALTLDTR
jgi:hypothetical protein